MIEFLKSILFGIVEGVTEWLPVSSTGHMILLNEFIQLDVSTEFYRMYEVVIQLGAILAVVLLFWKDLCPVRKSRGSAPEAKPRYELQRETAVLWAKILAACIPAAVAGLLFDEVFEELFYNYLTVALALAAFGIAFLVIENCRAGKPAEVDSLSELPYQTVFIIGLFQLLAAVFPGTSRSGATIAGALLLGVSRSVAAEFTFMLAVPVMFGASLLKILKFGLHFTSQELTVLVAGMAAAFFTSVLIIRFLMNFVKKHDFKVFGWYRILLALLVLSYFSWS